MFKHLFKWLGHPKHWVPGLTVAALLVILLMVSGGGYYYIEHNPRFCLSCHTMTEPFQRWKEGTHAMVNCHACHKQSKLESLHQVWMYLTKRPNKVIHHPHLDHNICVQCHLNKDQRWHDVGETAGHKVHFERGGIECLDCHNKGIHNIAKPEGICVTCHSDKADMHNKMAFMKCTQCHNFLAKGELKPTSQTCRECHDKIRLGKNHPSLKKQPDCIACHKPHNL